MNRRTMSALRGVRNLHLALMLGVLCLAVLAVAPAVEAVNLDGLTVIGIEPDGTQTPVTDYRWLVEKDLTYHVGFDASGSPVNVPFSDPAWDSDWENTLSVSFYRTYMPLVGKGCFGDGAWQTAAACKEVPIGTLEANQDYFVSVLPRDGGNPGWTIGGVAFKSTASGGVPAGIIVYVHRTPLPTAQISIFVFPDTAPTNGAPDTPTEDPAENGTDMSGFKIILEDGGGRYGVSAGTMSTDIYGNPLGTTYLPGCDPYDAACVNQVGNGIFTDSTGWAHIYNLAQGKYGIQAVPPAGSGWIQTSTIEGTHIIDAWVKPNEPEFFAEFGPPGPHVFLGFVKETNDIPAPPVGGSTATISGTVVNQHMSRPPDYTFYNGACFGHTTPWVGLNSQGGLGPNIFVSPTDANCGFSIPSVPDGNYELVVWDSALDLIIAFKAISIAGGQCNTPSGSCSLGDVPVFQWFHRQEHFVFNDYNGNGLWEPNGTDGMAGTIDDEDPLPDVPLNIRWRDGTVFQTNVTDKEGAFAFDEVFPFFSWLVAETGYTRLQATGVTVVTDNGGPIDPNNQWSYGGQLNPQDQTNPADPACLDPNVCVETPDYRVEKGPVLLEAFQGFIGTTNAYEWGKRHYPDGENGGITGIAFYDTTRAENNPQGAAGEPWEPGIPGVQVNVYGLGPDLMPNTADDVLFNSTVTDSWDAAIPTGCKYGDDTGPFVFSPDGGINEYPRDCYDGLRNFNQTRPGVFDGGYAFDAICAGGMTLDPATGQPYTDVDGTVYCDDTLTTQPTGPMPVGDYVVEVVPPMGYELYKPEDKNVDFGDSYQPPVPALTPPLCVGDLVDVPQFLTLFPDEGVEVVNWSPGMQLPLCDKKLVRIEAGTNAAADFFLFTEVPVAAHAIGFILDDTQNEFDPNAPNFGEKYAPPFMPVSIKDWTGREIGRTYSDQYGLYNFMVPSTATINAPQPSGVSPNMLTACMNDATLPNGDLDPQHNPIYSQFCYTLQYMPGVYTYLDTPVIPVGAFAGPDRYPVDCEFPNATPRIGSVSVADNLVGGGPYVPTYRVNTGPPAGRGVFTQGAHTITINAYDADPTTAGVQVWVPNPDYCNPLGGSCPAGADTVHKVIARDSGFGSTQGTLSLGGVTFSITSWTDAQIQASIPADTYVGPASSTAYARQLTVTRADGGSTVTGITVQFGLRGTGTNQGHVVQVIPDPGGNPLSSPLQDAINTAGPNDLILVSPGIYNEMVVMWKPIQLQGWGEGSTKINALKQPADKLTVWRSLVQTLLTNNLTNLLPGQELAFGGIEQVALLNEEGAGVLVLGSAGNGSSSFGQSQNQGARIDGFTITGADTGGGIIVNGYGAYMDISNNRVAGNSGSFSGGIRVGHALLLNANQDGYEDGQNDYVRIHHNTVNQNGAIDGAGAGISMGKGSDSYQITDNWVCGNFSTGNGGGIGHIGLSDRAANNAPVPLIARNRIIFNEIFNQGTTIAGAGLYVGGAPPLVAGTLGEGTGDLRINRNLIQGNGNGAGDAGGIRLEFVNGLDVANFNNSNNWYGIDIFNNMIVDNVAGLAGAGISLQDAVKVNILHNTIANNDSLGIAGQAFQVGSPNQATPQPGAGIVTRANSPQLVATGKPVGAFSDPNLQDTIVWHNRQFYFWVDTTSGCTPGDPGCTSTYGLCPDVSGALNCPGGNTVVYDDLGVLGAVGSLTCDSASCTTSTVGTAPSFVRPYVNGARSDVFQPEITTAIQANPAFDEGGNFIRPNYGPLTRIADPSVTPNLLWDYHLLTGNGGGLVNCSQYEALCPDYDGDVRATGAGTDIGADEVP